MAMQVRHARRLAAVKKMIMEEPRRFDINYWVRSSSRAPCGTTACIAGFLVWRADGRSALEHYLKEGYVSDIEDRAVELLNLGMTDVQSLFLVEEWPDLLQDEYYKRNEGSQGAAEVACRRIDAFLADHGFGSDGERLPTTPMPAPESLAV